MQARVLLGLVAATYGTNYACVKQLDEMIGSPAVAATLRFGVAATVLLPALASISTSHPRVMRWPVARDGLEVGTWFAAGYCAQAVALETSAAGLQAFLLSLSVVVCPLLESVVEHKQLAPRTWAAASLAALGVASLELGSTSFAANPGDVIGLLQPLLFGVGFFRLEQAMARHATAAEPDEPAEGIHALAVPLALTAWQMVAVLAASVLWAALSEGPAAADMVLRWLPRLLDAPAEGAASVGALVVWTGFVTTAGCAFAEAISLGELSASSATVVFATEPLWGALFANLMLGETMGATGLLGGAMVVLACLVSTSSTADEILASLELPGRWRPAELAMGLPLLTSISSPLAAAAKDEMVALTEAAGEAIETGIQPPTPF